MSLESSYSKKSPLEIPFRIKRRELSPETLQKIHEVFEEIEQEEGKSLEYVTQIVFTSPILFPKLNEALGFNRDIFKDFVRNTNRFERETYRSGSGLFGEEVLITGTSHKDGAQRRDEAGRKINMGYVTSKNIDPSKVLFFRLSLKSDHPKPEFYWTTDLFEVTNGLKREIPHNIRKDCVILVSSLQIIDEANDGLIQDINDDNGLAVRQIGTKPFDTSQCIVVLPWESSLE